MSLARRSRRRKKESGDSADAQESGDDLGENPEVRIENPEVGDRNQKVRGRAQCSAIAHWMSHAGKIHRSRWLRGVEHSSDTERRLAEQTPYLGKSIQRKLTHSDVGPRKPRGGLGKWCLCGSTKCTQHNIILRDCGTEARQQTDRTSRASDIEQKIAKETKSRR